MSDGRGGTCSGQSKDKDDVQVFLKRARQLLSEDPKAMAAVERMNAAADRVRPLSLIHI